MPTRRALLLTILAGLPAASLAQAPPGVAGLWQTIDDRTGQPRATVRLFEAQGRIYGNVERALDPAYAGAICERCTDDRKGKPVEGLQIIRGLARDGDEWNGGTILDPETGATYRCSMRLADGGRKLVVRGYLGISLLGRSQTWLRAG